jgi:hypothetical protein
MEFVLNCWVPSLSGFYKIKELRNRQISTLSKYILNEDHPGTNQCFEEIIKENFVDYNAYSLNRFDKWFILTFLRAINVSPTLYLQTTNTGNIPCNIEISLFDILTKLSEINCIDTFKIGVENINFLLQPYKLLFTDEPVLDSIATVEYKGQNITDLKLIKELLLKNVNLRNYIAQELLLKDGQSQHYIIKNNNTSLNLADLPVRVYDNTLFFFVRSIYLPYCKGLYDKQYNLMRFGNFSYSDLQQLTPAESDIFLNLFKQDESDKSQSNGINIQ